MERDNAQHHHVARLVMIDATVVIMVRCSNDQRRTKCFPRYPHRDFRLSRFTVAILYRPLFFLGSNRCLVAQGTKQLGQYVSDMMLSRPHCRMKHFQREKTQLERSMSIV